MPFNHEWQSRIKSVEREYMAMRQAANHFRQKVREDPNILLDDLRNRDIEVASGKLEGTYVIRLFAEFETGARQCWNERWESYPKTADLLEGLAARFTIPDAHREHCHSVREYRNNLVHEREGDVEALTMSEARAYLCVFFSFLPHRW